jgi:hypothetical protein
VVYRTSYKDLNERITGLLGGTCYFGGGLAVFAKLRRQFATSAGLSIDRRLECVSALSLIV